ncbi:MAG: serine hydrolase [Bacteroidetes bacterium]|nr:serine hydrolase [Bacteroidota bacterium]
MTKTKTSFATLLLFLILAVSTGAQSVPKSLPRSTPEVEGVSSEAISSFLAAAAKSKHEFHSIMVLRHGKVVAEGWWDPYGPELRHTLYSCSKSFTATAVGFAVSEGRLSVNDKVVSFFPEYLPDSISPFLAELTVKHLLSMTVGQEPDPSFSVASRDSNWLKGFLNTPILYQPGTRFLYNSLATYMAGAIVQKVTGQSLVDYLKPRLFEPLGIEGMDWETEPMGRNVGGWGLRVRTEDMAKFAQLFLQKGKWEGRQILPEAWVEEATTMKILQKPDIAQAQRDKDDWAQGYCYQMWRSRHNSFRGDGAYGQYMLVLPEQDAVIAITAESSDLQGELDLVWDHLLPAFQKDALPENPVAVNLQKKLSLLALLMVKGSADSPVARDISGKTFDLQPNEENIKSISFGFGQGSCKVVLTTEKDVYPLIFGSGDWAAGVTKRLGPSLVADAKGHFVGLPPPKVVGNYAWMDENILQLKLRYIESPHSELFTCHFDGNRVTVEYESSISFGSKKVVVEGEMK